ncbi:MAG TPA: hypothetical protein VEJ16_01470 [Alphaproteobacteria bacterium]|nr:hypothetical protein [Alphaproteobacteria bacterium]
MIGSPSYDGSVRKEYMTSVLALVESLRAKGIEYTLNLKARTLVHVARNLICADFLSDRSCSHLLFLDTDIGFHPSVVSAMLARDEPVVGCGCPYREMPFQRKAVADKTVGAMLSELFKYNIDPVITDNRIVIENGFLNARSVGAALFLIARRALETIVQSNAAPKYLAGEFPPNYYGFFDYIFEGGRQIGEDRSFCARWLKTNGKPIPCLVTEYVSHVGPIELRGRYSDQLAMNSRQAEPASG